MSDEEVVGTAIIRVVVDRSGVKEEIDKAVQDTQNEVDRGTKERGKKNGRQYADEFTKALESRMRAAEQALPILEVTASTSAASAKLEELRVQLHELGHLDELDIQIGDADAVAKIEAVKAELLTLTAHAHDVRIRTDAAAAIAQLEAFKRTLELANKQQGEASADAFSRAFAQRLKAAEAALPKIEINASTTDADAKLETLRTQLFQLGHAKELGIDLTDAAALAKIEEVKAELRTLTGRDHDIRMRVNAAAAIIQLEALKKVLDSIEAKKEIKINAAKAAPTDQQMGLWRTVLKYAAAFAPALVTIGGAAVAMGAGLAIGAGVLAVVYNEIRKGTVAGSQYAAEINAIKASYQSLAGVINQQIAPSFKQIEKEIVLGIPSLRSSLAPIISDLGQSVAHLINGLIGGMKTFQPVLDAVFDSVVRVSAKYDAWANGPGGAKFAQTLKTDYEAVAPALDNLGHAIEKILAAANTPGLGVIRMLSDISDVLAHIPSGPLQVAITALSTMKIAGILSGMFSKLALSVEGTAAAELRLAVAARTAAVGQDELAIANARVARASAGMNGALASTRAGLGGVVGVLGKFAVGWAVASIVTDQLSRATEKWKTSADGTQRMIGDLAKGADDLIHLKFSAAFSDAFGANRAKNDAQAAWIQSMKTANLVNMINLGVRTSLKDVGVTLDQLHQGVLTGEGSLATSLQGVGNALGFTATHLTVAQQLQNLYNEEINKVNASLKTQATLLMSAGTSGRAISEISSAYDTVDNAIQKNIDSTSKLLALGGDQVDGYKGIKIGANTVTAAMDAWNVTQQVAQQRIHALIDGLTLQQNAIVQNTAAQGRINEFIGFAETKYKLTGEQVDQYTQALGLNAIAIGNNNASLKQAEQLLGEFVGALKNGSTAVDAWVTAVAAYDKSGQTLADRAALIGAALVSFNGDAIAYANSMNGAAVANQKMVTDLKNVAKGVINLKTGVIDYHNAAAALLLGDLQALQTAAMNAAAATYQHEVATGHSKQAAKDAALVYRNDTITALEAEAQQLGLTKTEADKLATRYFNWPKDAITQIKMLGSGTTNSLLNAIGKQLSYLTHHPWTFNIGANVSPTAAKILNLIPTGGGTFNLPGGGGSLNAAGNIYNSYAAGGENHVAQIASTRPGMARVWAEPETRGEAYIPFADDWRRPRAKQITQTVAAKLGGVAYFQDGGTSGTDQGGFTGVDFGGGTSTKKSSSSSSSSSKGALSLSALQAFLQALPGTLTAIERAEKALAIAVSRAAGGKSLLAWLADENKQLVAMAKQRDMISNELAKARAYYTAELQLYSQARSTTSGAVGSFFSIASAGVAPTGGLATLGNIEAQQLQALNQVRQFKTGLTKLIQEGFDKNYVMQIASQGPGALPQVMALIQASPKEIALINSRESAISRLGNQLGIGVAQYEYGDQLRAAQALLNGFDPKKNPKLAREVYALANQLFGVGKYFKQGLIEGLKTENSELTKAVEAIGAHIVAVLKAKLKIHSPSAIGQDIGANFAGSIALGMHSQTATVQHAAGTVAAAMTPGYMQPNKSAPKNLDPDVKALIDAMREWFAHPPVLTVDGIAFGKLMQTVSNVEGRRN